MNVISVVTGICNWAPIFCNSSTKSLIDGEYPGYSKRYDLTGRIYQEISYENGFVSKNIRYYNYNGNDDQSGTYIDFLYENKKMVGVYAPVSVQKYPHSQCTNKIIYSSYPTYTTTQPVAQPVAQPVTNTLQYVVTQPYPYPSVYKHIFSNTI